MAKAKKAPTSRTRYPAKISIVAITQETRDLLNAKLQQKAGRTEAEIVRDALDKYLAEEA